MRPQNEIARERLETELRKAPPVAAGNLARQLNVSLPTILRILREREERIIRLGSTKNARYALRRPLRGITKPIPVYRIDTKGKGHHCGALELVDPQGSRMDLRRMGWPADMSRRDGWWDGLPYPLHDMRPQGFLGRNFARSIHQENAISVDPREWSDDDIVHVLTRYGSDTSGNLIVGDQAYSSWLRAVANPQPPLPHAALHERYTELADLVTNQASTGSSTAGEFPKFTASRALPDAATPHVIVKFSGADESSTVRRWSDLLVCESLALQSLGEKTDLDVAHTRVLKKRTGRTFLEVERFDRHGPFGRSELLSLDNLNAALIGKSTSSWPELVSALGRLGLADAALQEHVRLAWWYGRLIANTDMHLGNLSFRLGAAGKEPALRIAPLYDMLPMQYAPLPGGEVPVREFDPPLPLPLERETWHAACGAAMLFWNAASADPRISEPFRAQCQRNRTRLEELRERV